MYLIRYSKHVNLNMVEYIQTLCLYIICISTKKKQFITQQSVAVVDS